MSTSLVHLGDFHAAPGPRNEARYRALDQVIDAGLQLPNLGAWLWPGDLSHQRQAIADELALIDRLRAMANRAPVIIARGNHDIEGDLDKFESIKATFPIVVVNRPRVVKLDLATGEPAAIACLPYPHKAGLVAAGAANADVVDAAADALESIFMQFAAELEAARAKGDLTLFIGHVNVGGAIASSGQPNIGKEIELSPRHLDRLGPIYKGLNHIHKPQEIAGAYYAGSICRLDWGEIEEKRWLELRMLTTDEAVRGTSTADAAEPWAFSVVSHPIDVAPMYHVEGVLTRDGFTYEVAAGPGGEKQDRPARLCPDCFGAGDGASAACQTCAGACYVVSWQGCEVRARYTFKQSEAAVVDKSLVAREFAEASLFLPDPIAVPDRQLRAPEVAAAKTLPDKVAAWCALAGTVASEGVIEKLAKLETIADAQVHVEAARDHASDIAAGDEQKASAAA